MQKRPFVLSGGGCRGFAHLGAVKAFQEEDIYPSEIAGTSAGSIAGAFLASGFTPDEIRDLFVDKLKMNMLAWNGFKMGMVSMKNIASFLKKNMRYKNIEDLPVPFYVTATNFINGRQTVFDKGDIVEIITAASSIPILFPPVFIEGIPFVDGGVSNNLPIEPFINKKDEVISIYVNPIKLFSPEEKPMELMDRTLHLIHREMTGRAAEGCFLYLEPSELKGFGLFDIPRIPDIFEVGYRYTKELLKDKKLVKAVP
ncbi:MAG TPA: patatin-like phospholipase family protein [Puia sp.]